MIDQRHNFDILHRIIIAANEAESMDALLHTILDLTLELLHFDGGGIYLLDTEKSFLEIKCHRGFHEGFIGEVRTYGLDTEYTMPLVAKSQPLFMEDYSQVKPERSRKYGIETAAVIPLVSKNITIGCINVSKNQRHAFSDLEKETLASIGRETGTAIARMQIETALRESERKYKEMTESISESIYEIDTAGNIVFVNSAAHTQFGYTENDIRRGLNVFDLIDPGDLTRAHANFKRLLEGEKLWNEEYTVRRKDGTAFSAEIIMSPVRTNGIITGFRGLLINISRRKQAEAALKHERDFNSILIHASPAFFAAFNPEGRVIMMNTSMLNALGYAPHEVVGLDYVETFIPERERPFVMAGISSITKDSAAITSENHILTRDGRELLVEWHSRQVLSADGTPEFYFGIGIDITERRKAENTLRDSEETYHTIFDSVTDGLLVLDIETGDVVELNNNAARIYGYSIDEKHTISFNTTCIDEEPYTVNDALRLFRKCANGEPLMFEWLAKKKNGEKFWIEVNIRKTVIRGRERILSVIRDITKKKKAEDELIKAQKLESLGVLAGGIAHDFNNILTVIIGNISLAKMHLDSDLDVFKIIAEAEKASIRARDLSQQLLTFSKGGAPIKNISSIADLLRETIAFILSGSNIRPEFSIQNDLWLAEIDEGQISQVINNIVINAQQAMPAGGVIRIRAENKTISARSPESQQLKKGKYIRIIIQDAGVGIPAGVISRVFDPYFTTKPRGSGLGLSTSYSIVKKHNGHIEIESKEGKETTVTLYLPATNTRREPAKDGTADLSLAHGKILLMDDDEFILDLGIDMLSYLGYEVATARDGSIAIAMYKKAMKTKHPFDAVIMDITIPGGMGGGETIAKLRELHPGARVLVSSGYSNNPIMSNYRDHGFDGVLTKPYDINDVSIALRDLLAGR